MTHIKMQFSVLHSAICKQEWLHFQIHRQQKLILEWGPSDRKIQFRVHKYKDGTNMIITLDKGNGLELPKANVTSK